MAKQKETLYSSFTPANKEDIFKAYGNSRPECHVVQHPKSTASLAYPVDTTTSIRPPFGNSDYTRFRPGEAVPCDIRDVIIKCREIYIKSGVVRNVIDMMTDFITEGLKILDVDKKNEIFFNVWAEKAKLKDAVEEFARHMLIDCNVVVKRKMAKLTLPAEKEWSEYKANAEQELETIKVSERQNKREIPWRYIFLNVAALEWTGDELDKINNKRELVFRVSNALKTRVSKIRGSGNKVFDPNKMDRMPQGIEDVLIRDDGTVKVDLEKVYISYGKKDSWEDWSIPYLYSILQHIIFKEKLLQADSSALDGVINAIRVWKLGDHKEGIIPSDLAFAKLSGILESNTGGGSIDIIWDSLIDVQDIYPPIDKILGSTKYEQVDKDILIGLGVPEVLIGGKGANFSNSYIQLKTLIERLKYVRRKIVDWVNAELVFVKKAMDITSYPKVRFSANSFDDENINKKLIVGLLDRGIISVEAVLEAYGEDYLIELNRMNDEGKSLKKFGVEVKSPFNQNGQSVPSQGPGRPSQTQDVERKTRTPKVKKANFELITKGLAILDMIEENILPVYIKNCGVSNARQLTNQQKEDFTNLRISILSMVKLDDELSGAFILSLLDNVKNTDPSLINSIKNHINISLACINKYTVYDQKLAEALAWSNNFNKEE